MLPVLSLRSDFRAGRRAVLAAIRGPEGAKELVRQMLAERLISVGNNASGRISRSRPHNAAMKRQAVIPSIPDDRRPG